MAKTRSTPLYVKYRDVVHPGVVAVDADVVVVLELVGELEVLLVVVLQPV